MPVGPLARNFPGFSSNRSLQPELQKEYVVPSCSVLHLAVWGSTFIPQTGSVSFLANRGMGATLGGQGGPALKRIAEGPEGAPLQRRPP